MEESLKWILATAAVALLLPVVIYYSIGRRYDRVRPDIDSAQRQPSDLSSPVPSPTSDFHEPGQSDSDDEDGFKCLTSPFPSSEAPGDFLPAFLSSIKVFGFMERPVFDLLAAHLQERKCAKGDIILQMDRYGQTDRSFYVVVDGKVEVNCPSNQSYLFESGQMAMHTVGPGGTVSSLFSILSIFADHPKPTVRPTTADEPSNDSREHPETSSIRPIFPRLLIKDTPDSDNAFSSAAEENKGGLIARAVEDCRLLMIPERAFHQLAVELPSAAAHITSVVLTRFQRVTFLSLYRYLGLAKELAAMESDLNSSTGGSPNRSAQTSIDAGTQKREFLTSMSAADREALLISTATSILKCLQIEDQDSELARQLALQHTDLRYLQPDEVLAQHGARNPGLFHVIFGVIEGRICGTTDASTIIYTVNNRGLCGTLAAFLGHTSFIDIVAKEESVVAVLTRRGVQLLIKRDPNVMFRLAKGLLSRLTPLVRSIDLLLDWRHMNAGKVLIRPGETIEGVYIVLNGRLRNITKNIEYGQGDVIGASAVLTGLVHRSTVIAVRDCELACMPKSLFELLTRSFPSLTLSMSRNLAARQIGLQSSSLSKAIAIIPSSSEVPIHEFAERLQAELSAMESDCTLIESTSVTEALGCDAFAPIASLKLSEWLAEQEDAHSTIILLADTNPASLWTKKCIRQADCILIVALAESTPLLSPIERAVLKTLRSRTYFPRKELVLLHGMRLCSPGSTMTWLKQRPWVAHHHHIYMHNIFYSQDGDSRHHQAGLDLKHVLLPTTVRRRLDRPYPRASTAPGGNDDFGRLARHITCRSIGVVLSGGGARGVAHVGALRALCEQNIPIDIIGGTSMGAFVGGLYASDGDWLTLPSRIRYFCERAGSRWRQLADLTWPYCAWFSGHSFNRALWKLFGSWMIDDLWLPFYCVTTDITCSRKAVHRADGSCDDYVWRYVRASMSLSGLVPPVCDRFGHMHVDGGYLSTVPVEVMSSEFTHSLHRVIVVDVSSVYNDPGRYQIGDAVSGLLPALKHLLGFDTGLPSLEEIQTRIAFVSSDGASASLLRDNPNVLVIRPDVGHLGILDFGKYQEAMRLGYDSTLEAIKGWRGSGALGPAKRQQSEIKRARRSSL